MDTTKQPITLDDLKAYLSALDARASENGTTKEQRELLERFAGIDLFATAITLIEERDATITAQSRLLALAETLAGAVVELLTHRDFKESGEKALDFELRPLPWDAVRAEAEAFTTAQAEYKTTGTVPCGECERLQSNLRQADGNHRIMYANLCRVETERDDLRHRLNNANARLKTLDAITSERDDLRHQLEYAQAEILRLSGDKVEMERDERELVATIDDMRRQLAEKQNVGARQYRLLREAEDNLSVSSDNLRDLWAALGMIREAVEALAPPGSVKSSDHLDDPEPSTEAEALIIGITALRSAYDEVLTNNTALAEQEKERTDG